MYVEDNIMSLNFLGMRKIFTEGPRENEKHVMTNIFSPPPPGNLTAYKVIESIRQS
jgi:hypothetical protein